MMSNLPYIPVDEELDLNTAILAMLLFKLGKNSRGNCTLDFEKIQAFLYLIKNPSKISKMLMLADKPRTALDKKLIHTIESMSGNVDILFNRKKLKVLLRRLASLGFLKCEGDIKSNSIRYYLTTQGCDFAETLIGEREVKHYFGALVDIVSSLLPLQSQPATKINSWLNSVLKGS